MCSGDANPWWRSANTLRERMFSWVFHNVSSTKCQPYGNHITFSHFVSDTSFTFHTPLVNQYTRNFIFGTSLIKNTFHVAARSLCITIINRPGKQNSNLGQFAITKITAPITMSHTWLSRLLRNLRRRFLTFCKPVAMKMPSCYFAQHMNSILSNLHRPHKVLGTVLTLPKQLHSYQLHQQYSTHPRAWNKYSVWPNVLCRLQ